MSYERLVERAEDASPLTVASLPDGSVDTLYRVEGGGGPIHSRRSFGERVAAGWDWPVALALGNACAGHYLERGETLRFDGLRNYLDDRGEVDG